MTKWIVLFYLAVTGTAGADVTLLSSYSWATSDVAFGGFLSLHPDDRKRIRITLISDDNFNVFQRTDWLNMY